MATDFTDLKILVILSLSIFSPSIFKAIPFFRDQKNRALNSLLMGSIVAAISFLLFSLLVSSNKTENILRSSLLGVIVAESTVTGLPEGVFPAPTTIALGYLIFLYYNAHTAHVDSSPGPMFRTDAAHTN